MVFKLFLTTEVRTFINSPFSFASLPCQHVNCCSALLLWCPWWRTFRNRAFHWRQKTTWQADTPDRYPSLSEISFLLHVQQWRWSSIAELLWSGPQSILAAVGIISTGIRNLCPVSQDREDPANQKKTIRETNRPQARYWWTWMSWTVVVLVSNKRILRQSHFLGLWIDFNSYLYVVEILSTDSSFCAAERTVCKGNWTNQGRVTVLYWCDWVKVSNPCWRKSVGSGRWFENPPAIFISLRYSESILQWMDRGDLCELCLRLFSWQEDLNVYPELPRQLAWQHHVWLWFISKDGMSVSTTWCQGMCRFCI